MMKKAISCLLALMLLAGMANLALAAQDPLGKYETPVTVRYARNAGLDMQFKEGQSYEENIWMTEYADVLGINVETVWTAEGVDAYNQKLQLSIVGQDIPDIFVCNSSQFKSLVEADMLEDLTAVLAEYQSDLVKENLAADGGSGLQQCTVKGQLFGLPRESVGANKMMYTFIREDWREKLGLPEPKTMDDLVAMAKAFTEQDPDGNGVNDTFGFGIGNQPFETYMAMKGYFNGFGAFPDQWIMKDGQAVFGSIQPEMKAALAAMRGWYEQGLIDPEFVVKDNYATSQDMVAGKNGIHVGEWWVITWPIPDGMKLGAQWKSYPILYDASAPEQKVGAVAKLDARYVVRKGFEHPEALVKMYNLFQERVMSQNYDTTIYKTDGKYSFQDLTAVYTVIGADRNMRNHLVVTEAVDKRDPSLLENADQQDEYRRFCNYLDKVDEGLDKNVDSYTHTMAFYGPESVFGRLANYMANDMFKLDPFYGSDTPAMQSYAAQLKSNAEEMILNIITGEADLDSFDKFVEDWKALGGDEMTKEVNEWLAQQ